MITCLEYYCRSLICHHCKESRDYFDWLLWMVSSSRRTNAERGILKVFLNIAKITTSYVGCPDLSSEVEVKLLQGVN